MLKQSYKDLKCSSNVLQWMLDRICVIEYEDEFNVPDDSHQIM